MLENDLICLILFQEEDMQNAQWILGLVDEEQFFSPDNGFIEVKNFYNKTIGKTDIQDIKFCKECSSVVIDKNNLSINTPILMES